MSVADSQPAVPEPKGPWFQYSLRTMLLMFVVLASSLAEFGTRGIEIFIFTVGLAIYLNRAKSFGLWILLLLLPPGILIVIDTIGLLLGLLLPAIAYARESGWRPIWPSIAALAVWLLSVGTLLTLAVRRRKMSPVPPTPPAPHER